MPMARGPSPRSTMGETPHPKDLMASLALLFFSSVIEAGEVEGVRIDKLVFL